MTASPPARNRQRVEYIETWRHCREPLISGLPPAPLRNAVLLSDIRDDSGLGLSKDLLEADPALGLVLVTDEPIPQWVHDRNVPVLFKPVELVTLADAIPAAGRSGQPISSAPAHGDGAPGIMIA